VRASLTQHELADRLNCSQQAIAQAERRASNPTIAFMRRWASACGGRLTLRIRPRSG
jgi:transcriptional regulator with XRE-family HTH domain